MMDHTDCVNGEICSDDSLEDTLFDYVRKNDLIAADAHLSNTPVNVNQLNSTAKRCMYFALENENVHMVKLLVEHGADINLSSYSHQYSWFETPLVTAVRLENEELIDLLLGMACDTEKTCCRGREEKTALQWAATYGNIALAEKLYNHGADVNWIGPSCHTALHYAANCDKADMVQWLLEKGAEVTGNCDGRSPLHISAVRGNLAIIKHLFSHDCDVNVHDRWLFTPFSLACLRGHQAVVSFMLENAPDGTAFNLSDGLHRAAESGHTQVMKMLLARGADPNALNALGESPLSTAARAGKAGPVQLLLNHGSRLDIIDKRGYNPLQLSLLREQVDISITLIQHGSPLHNPKSTESALYLAVTTSNPLLVKCILQAGCRLYREPWFTDKHAFGKLQDMEYMTPGPLRFRRESDHQKETWRWIISKLNQPWELKNMCRIAIREQLVVCTNSSSIVANIEALPLPPAMKSLVALKDVLNE